MPSWRCETRNFKHSCRMSLTETMSAFQHSTKTGNDVRLPVIPQLKRLLADGWGPINLRTARRQILKRLKGTTLRWKGWYEFRRGMVTNLFELGVRPEEAALILRNTPEVVLRHYLKLGKKMPWPVWIRLTTSVP